MSFGRRRVGSDEYERGYAHGRRDAEHDFQKLMSRSVLWVRPGARPIRSRNALDQDRKSQPRGPNPKLQVPRQKRQSKLPGDQSGGVDTRIRLDRTTPGDIECPLCDRTFTSEHGLSVHVGRTHKNGASPPP